jgi:hypothetical protein
MQWLKDALNLLAPGWVGSIIGLIGIAVAALTYFVTRQRGLLVYRYAGERLLGLSTDGLPADIVVQYRGQEIQRLTRTLLVFWNAGEKTVLVGDIVASDPLRLKIADDGSVLAATVLKQARAVSQVTALVDPMKPNEIALSFAFLDSGDGAVIEVLHTSEKWDIDVMGTVRGFPRGIHDLGRIEASRYIRHIFALPGTGWVFVATGLSIAIAGYFVPQEWLSNADILSINNDRVEGVVFALFGISLIFGTRRRYPKSLHVDELD